jgi:hypothetical protein
MIRTAQNPHAPMIPVPTQKNVPSEPIPFVFHATSELNAAAMLIGASSGFAVPLERSGISGLCPMISQGRVHTVGLDTHCNNNSRRHSEDEYSQLIA